jgi:hypothetical protein
MGDLVPIVLFIAGAVMVINVTRIISDGRTRRQLIRGGVTPETAAAIIAASPTAEAHASLRWGLLTGAVGLALIVVQFLPYKPDEPISLGIVLLFGAAGLLAYHFASRRLATNPQV